MRVTGRCSPTRLVTGDRLGYDTEVVERVLRCSCGTVQTELFDPEEPRTAAIRKVACMFCGVTGQMRMWRAA